MKFFAFILWTALAAPSVSVTPQPVAPPAIPSSANEHVAYWIRTVNTHPLKLIRRNAARVLGNMGDPSAIPALAAALKDPFYGVRQESARSLGLLGDEQALSPLTDTLRHDTDAQVRRAAQEAIERIKLHQDVLKKKEEKLQGTTPK